MITRSSKKNWITIPGAVLLPTLFIFSNSQAQPLPGGTLDPTSIPKFVTPLVIPPVMKKSNDGKGNGTDHYKISVRQFKQQILPAGYPATTVWSYGPDDDTPPDVAPVPAAESQFNYPAFTIETKNGGWDGQAFRANKVKVDWINGLVDNKGQYLPHLFAVDQTLHWANPVADCRDGIPRSDCRGNSGEPYTGPVPIVTHVHGAHTGPDSDGYPEAWYLPEDKSIECVDPKEPQLTDITKGWFLCEGSLANQFGTGTNTKSGKATYTYTNDQPSTTLWYHDHTLGMTRLNVYAGPAGFWLVRTPDGGENGLDSGALPGPAPAAGEDPNFVAADRIKVREIPIVIQGRSFNDDGSLFYPANRAFFEGLGEGVEVGENGNLANGVNIPFLPNSAASDISPIWNPEAFFNVMVVNGVSWPYFDVEPERYRLRLLNGTNSRFLNLAMFVVVDDGADSIPGNADDTLGAEVPFYQIGADQSLFPAVVRVTTGCKINRRADLDATGCPNPTAELSEALLMGPAERADVIVDFTGLAAGTRIRMVNTAPDAPFGGFPDDPADADTTGQVMEFTVIEDSSVTVDNSSTPKQLRFSRPDQDDWTTKPGNTRKLALLEEESAQVCVIFNETDGTMALDAASVPPNCNPDPAVGSFAFAPKAAVLGTSGNTGGIAQLWDDPIEQNPQVGDTENWQLWNWSADAHPIHVHLVKFRVVNRKPIGGTNRPAELTERGWKDTVIAYPDEVTTIRAKFDTAGLYVWHCHILEHEDNEMMVPYCVGDPNANGCAGL